MSRRGYKEAHISPFVSTPQSRLTPCQLPGRGAFWVLPLTKSFPVYGESGCECNEQTKGERLKAAKCRELFPLSFAYAQQNAGWNIVVLPRGCYICAKIYELTLWLEQGRLTHCRS